MSITDPAVATAVINEAKARGIYPGEMPETDEQKLAQGNELLRLAEQAKGAGVQGDAVIAVLNAAGQGDPGNPFGGAAAPAPPAAPPVAPPAPVAAPPVAAPPPPAPPVAAPAPPPPPAPPSQVEIKAPDGTVYMVNADQVAQYVAGGYTVVEGPIAGEVTPPPAPAQAAAPTGPVDPSQYSVTAPWDTYDKDKIPDIVSRIESVLASQGDAAKPLLAHVWEYESKNKNRQRLMGKLTEIATGAAPAAAPPPAPTAPEPQAPPMPPVGGDGAGVDPTPPFAPVAAAPPVAPVAPPVQPSLPDVSTPGFDQIVPPFENKATTLAGQAIAGEHLPVPQDSFAQSPPPQIPPDFTQFGDVQIAQYQSQFNACYARAYYLLSVAEGHSADAKIVGDGLVSTFIANNEFAKGTTVSQMEATATQAPEIQHARRVQHEWNEMARQLRALATIYEKTCERLSREQTRRDVDRQAR